MTARTDSMLVPLAAAEAGMITRLLWRRRYQRHLRRAFLQMRRAGYRPSSSAYEGMQRQARAYADGAG